MGSSDSRGIVLVLLLVCVIGVSQLNEVRARPVFRYVEFNGERKWPGQTHIVPHGITLRVVAALEEPNKQSMTADLILIDENGDARIERMERINTDVNKEWHAHDLDTNTLNPGNYTVRIKAWNAAREETGGEKAIKSEEVTWGDLSLTLEAQQTTQETSRILGFPWEGIVVALYLAVAAVIPIVVLRCTCIPHDNAYGLKPLFSGNHVDCIVKCLSMCYGGNRWKPSESAEPGLSRLTGRR